jgi:hypothetical protein
MFPTQVQPTKTLIAALTFTLGVIGLLLCSSSSHAQQEPNRQLVQTNAQRTGHARRIALVIGNGAYTNAPPLKNPPNDARDMAATLKQLGFTVASAINADQRTMKRLIREFGQQLKSGGQGLFYYAGHGVQLRGRNYLIPANAEIASETDVEDQGVDLSLVLGLMDEAENGLNIVILDACRNNPFARSFRSAGSGLAQVDAPTGTLIAYATSPGRVASDGQGRNGLYTSELLRQMLVTGIGVEEMFKRVRAGVQRQTSGQQVPWESSSLVGDFYFAAPTLSASTKNASNNGAAEEAVNRMALDPAAFELSYWDSIKSSTNPDDFKAYLEKYPGGQFATLAKNRIKSLEVAAKPAEPTPSSSTSSAGDLAFWDAIKNSTKGEDFEAYLKKYPNGEFAYLAKNRLTDLEASARQAREEADRRAAAQRQADEIARKTVTLKGSVTWSSPHGTRYSDLTLTVSPVKLSYVCGAGTGNFCVGEIYNFECSQFASAVIDGSAIREITDKPQDKNLFKFRFNAASPDEAARALEAIREVCKLTPQNSPRK